MTKDRRVPPDKRKPLGRPPGSVKLLTPAVQKKICDALEITVPIRHACAAVGIREHLHQRWMENGANGEEPYATYMHAVLVAQSKAVLNLTARALAGGKGSAAAMWFLGKRFPKDFPTVSRLEHSGVDGAPIGIEVDNITAMSDERLAELAAKLAVKKPADTDDHADILGVTRDGLEVQ